MLALRAGQFPQPGTDHDPGSAKELSLLCAWRGEAGGGRAHPQRCAGASKAHDPSSLFMSSSKALTGPPCIVHVALLLSMLPPKM